MDSFVRKLLTEWRRLKLPMEGETVIVAVSGGADSISLLLALNDLYQREKLRHRFVAAHFNHKLRGNESDADEAFVKAVTTQIGSELVVGHGNIEKKGNLEQNARNARYAFLSDASKRLNAFAIVTAHTMNDQAETFLLNLIRGSGRDGLCSMLPIREMDLSYSLPERADMAETDPLLPFERNSLLVRPLLRWASRHDTELFCKEKETAYRYDSMNEDLSFKRVRVRKVLLPILADMNPKIIETIVRTSFLLAEDLKDEIDLPSSDTLSVSELIEMSETELNKVIRRWIQHRRGSLRSISEKHIASVAGLAKSSKSGRIVELPKGATVIKRKGKLHFLISPA